MLNIKRTLIIVVYAIVRLHAPLLPQLTHFLLCCCYPFRTRDFLLNGSQPKPSHLSAPDAKPPTSLYPSHRPRVRIIPYNYIRFGTTPSGLEIEIKLSCFYTDGRERGKEWRTERDERIRRRREIVQQERLERFLSRLLRDEPTTVFCSRELRLHSLPLAPVFPLALPPNPHVLIFPGISALSLRLCKGLYRGVDRSSCSSTYPEIRCLYYAPNFVFSAVNFDRAICDLIDLIAILRAYYLSFIMLQ